MDAAIFTFLDSFFSCFFFCQCDSRRRLRLIQRFHLVLLCVSVLGFFFSIYRCSACLGRGAALSPLRGSPRLLRPPSGSISTLISAEAALVRHDHPSQTLEVRDCLPATVCARVSDPIPPAGASRSSAYPTSSSAPRRSAPTPGRFGSHLTPGEQFLSLKAG